MNTLEKVLIGQQKFGKLSKLKVGEVFQDYCIGFKVGKGYVIEYREIDASKMPTGKIVKAIVDKVEPTNSLNETHFYARVTE